jgi:hypothetical protein
MLGTVASGDLINCIGYQAVNLTGIVPISKGGTGLSAVGNLGEVLQVTTSGTLGYAPVPPVSNVRNGAPSQLLYQVNSSVTGFIPNGTSGQVLLSNGTLAPSWGFVSLTSNISGVLPISNGGTGTTTAQAAINALVGSVTNLNIVQGNGTNIVLAPLTPALVATAGTLSNNTTGSAATFTSTTQNSQFNSIGVNVAPSGTAGNINATGSISDGTGTLHPIVSGTAIAPSGTAATFTGIPSWAKRITMMVSSVQMTGGSNKQIQVGTAAGIVTTGYLGYSTQFAGGDINLTTGAEVFFINGSDIIQGQIVFNLLNPTSNTWTFSGVFGLSNASFICVVAGSVALSGPLTQIRLTSTNGTETFTAGSINILYE